MKPTVYKFHAALTAYPDDCWREFEILSTSTMGELGATVLAAFEASGKPPWFLDDGREYYEYLMPDDDFHWAHYADRKPIDPEYVQLAELRLNRTKELILHYDLERRWAFRIRLMGTRRVRNEETSYSFPEFLDGKGGPMMEQYDAEFMQELVADQKSGLDTREDIRYRMLLDSGDLDWRYDVFDREKFELDFRDEYIKTELICRGFGPETWYEDPTDQWRTI